MDIEHFALNVPDPVAAAAWYVEHLGMRVQRSLAALDAADTKHVGITTHLLRDARPVRERIAGE